MEGRNFFFIIFEAIAMIMLNKNILSCSALSSNIPCGPIILEEILELMSNSIKIYSILSLEIYGRYSKDLYFSYKTILSMPNEYMLHWIF